MQSMIAGGIGGTSGDLLMHSLDTVKTRQQGDPHFPPRYTSMSSTYATIFKQEGFRRGLYSGVTPAFLGSLPGTVIFFGAYEYSKRHLIDAGVPSSLSYLTAGGSSHLLIRLPSLNVFSQVSSLTSLPPSSMSRPKFSKPVSSYKAVTTIPFLAPATTTAPPPTLLALLFARKESQHSSTAIKRQSSAICPSRQYNSLSTSRNGG